MHSRRFLAFFVGLWLASLLTVTYVTAFSARTVNAVMENPPHEASKWVDILGKDRTHTLLLHNTAEVNRSILESWGYADLVLCVFILITAVMIKSGKPVIILATLLTVLCFASVFLLTPQVVAVGRLLDFRPGFPVPPERAQFASLNGMFNGVSAIRFLSAVAMVTLLVHRSQKTRLRRRSGGLDEIDPIDHANHSHINR
jgi:hypothetical protein